MDANLIGILVVPIGVSLCFGPALLVWIKEELQADSAAATTTDNKKKKR